MKVKDFAIIGVYTALLIGGQFALSFVAGVEVVTVLLLTFAYRFGFRRSLILVNAFCILRCFIFGFFPTVIILYFIYYNLFVLLFAFIGRSFKGKLTIIKLVVIVCLAALANACFTLLDDIITPLFYSFSLSAAKAYFITSLYTMALHVTNTVITVSLLFPPLNVVFAKIA